MIDDDPFAPASDAGIHRLAIPTPFAVGRVNVYLIEDEPLTLVDAGPNSGTSFDELQRGIAELGHALEDIELVLLTHQHIDHLGLVSLVAARSGAAVAAIDAAVPFVENFSTEAQADDDFAREIMLRHGIPADVVAALQSVSQAFRAWGARAEVTRPLREARSSPYVTARCTSITAPDTLPRTLSSTIATGGSSSPLTTCWGTSRPTPLLRGRETAPPGAPRRLSNTSSLSPQPARWTLTWFSPATATRSPTTAS